MKKERPAPKQKPPVEVRRVAYVPRVHAVRKPRVEWEYADQRAVIVWARGIDNKSGMLWKYPELELLYAIPNGRATHIQTRIKMVQEGAKKGMPDLCLPVARRFVEELKAHHALYIEMKHGPKSKADTDQLGIHAKLIAKGNAVVICHSHIEAIETIEKYLKGTPWTAWTA